MTVTLLVGAQWGDEGKGKIIDYLGEDIDLVARFQGGNNAGHTVVVGDKTYKLHFLPSGIVRGKESLLGNGMVINPESFLAEIAKVEAEGITVQNLMMSDRAHVITQAHIDEDSKESRIGTTKKGIGPAYTDKIRRTGKRIRDVLEVYPELKKYVGDTSLRINQAIDAGKNVLIEGAQGTLLDIDQGTYPFVTSSNTVAGGACTGLGIGPTKIDRVLGVVKAYTTRVGEGPFPTELEDATGEKLREQGHEFGTTTGRPRRCGWLDLVILNYSCRVNGLTELAITKLDVLSGIDTLNVGVAYRHNDARLESFPADAKVLDEVEVEYKEFPGWSAVSDEDWTRIRTEGFSALPKEAQTYLDFIEAECKTKIKLVSFGPERSDTFIKG